MHLSNNSESIWENVKEKRKSYLSNQSEDICKYQNNLIEDDSIKQNINKVQEKFNENSTTSSTYDDGWGTVYGYSSG